MNTKIQWKPLIISLAISLGTGMLSVLLTPNIQKKYADLYKPPLAPPGWVFPVVWTVLFIMMGIAAYLVFINSEGKTRRDALLYYAAQLLANLGWSVLFFRFGFYVLAFFWLLLLWYLVYTTIKNFAPISESAAMLLVPYLLWLTFAGYLNLAIAVHYL